MSRFIPCGVVAVGTNEMPDQIFEEGRAYMKTWMGGKVAVYQLENDPLEGGVVSPFATRMEFWPGVEFDDDSQSV